MSSSARRRRSSTTPTACACSTNKVEVDDDANPATALVVESETETTYLNDPDNHTGYAQTLEEVTRDAATQAVIKDLVFTLGHDVLSQTAIDPAQAGTNAGSPLYLLYDGHGSTRLLTDSQGAIALGPNSTPQIFAYDAFGLPIGFEQSAALTNLLYNGEWFDSHVNQQYLHWRWYDLSTGRFNRLDPFFGNLRDPQSFHKYLFTPSDPVNFNDPDGTEYTAGTVSMGSTMGMGLQANTVAAIAPYAVYVATGVVLGIVIYSEVQALGDP